MGYGPKADVWSIGVTVFKMLCSVAPFGGPSGASVKACYDAINNYNGVLDFSAAGWAGRSARSRSFCQSLLRRNPEDRPSAAEALRQPWLEEHKPEYGRLTKELVRSLEGYASSSRMVKLCLILVAARLDAQSLKDIRNAFIGIDAEGSGSVRQDKLEDALDDLVTAPCCNDLRGVDVEEIFQGCDMYDNGNLSYTEFVAACLYGKLRTKRGRELVSYAFRALDTDADGWVSISQLQRFFQQVDMPRSELLPRDGFNECSFYECIVAQCGGGFAYTPFGLGRVDVGEEDDDEGLRTHPAVPWALCGRGRLTGTVDPSVDDADEDWDNASSMTGENDEIPEASP